MLTRTPGPGRRRTCAANTALPCSVPIDVDLDGAGRGEGVGVGQRADIAEQARVVDPQVDPPEPRHHRRRRSARRRPGRSRPPRPRREPRADLPLVRGRQRATRGRGGGGTESELQAGGGEVDGQSGTRGRELAPVTTATRPRAARVHAVPRRTDRSSRVGERRPRPARRRAAGPSLLRGATARRGRSAPSAARPPR